MRERGRGLCFAWRPDFHTLPPYWLCPRSQYYSIKLTIFGIHCTGSPHLLSSDPPRVARNLSLGENAIACTFTLCRVSRQYRERLLNCHTMTSALNPMCVTCPEAKNWPDWEQARQEMLLECPRRKFCS